MKRTILILSVVLGFTALNPRTSFAVEDVKAPVEDPMMAEWKKNSTPGENHKVLDTLVGQWKHTIKWRMSPEAKYEESQGANENRWIMGNRFLNVEVKGQSMGQPFEGLNILGYDNVRGEYVSVWLDNMATGIMTATSQFDTSTKTLKETGSYACSMTGEKNKSFRADWKIVDNDHYTYEMYTKHKDGSEFKNLEIAYERI